MSAPTAASSPTPTSLPPFSIGETGTCVPDIEDWLDGGIFSWHCLEWTPDGTSLIFDDHGEEFNAIVAVTCKRR